MIHILSQASPDFPHPRTALAEPDGLLAAGGRLDARYMAAAYASGIFPWFSEGEPILWWSPSVRAVLDPNKLKISKSFSKTLRNKPWTVRVDGSFNAMVEVCAKLPRQGQPGTWIVDAMRAGYADLHASGLAHSVEVFHGDDFAGGLFGVKIGRMFYGESMASLRPDASKVALAALCLAAPRLGIELIDCQMMTPHLESMGARHMSRDDFIARVAILAATAKSESWSGRLEEFKVAAATASPARPAGEIQDQASSVPCASPALSRPF